MGFKQRPLPLWAQLALLMSTVLIVIVLGGSVVYETYWSQVLQQVSPQVAVAIEKVRPSLNSLLVGNRLRFSPGLISFLFSLGVIIFFSVLISKRILKPIEALEGSLNAIAGEPTKIARGQFAEVLEGVAALAAKLEHSENARRIANAAIAHELRTPLTVLRARVESLEFGVYPLELHEIGKLHSSLDLLEHLIEDLQTLSLADAGELRLEFQELELTQLIREVCLELQSNVQIIAPQSIQARLDPKRIRQVLYNLLENAGRYTPKDSIIEIHLESNSTHLHIRIIDNGTGVPDNELEKLFTPFYRLEPSRSREHGGSGLGLAVVQAIITAHGGSVKAGRAISGGLEIQIKLPLNARDNA